MIYDSLGEEEDVEDVASKRLSGLTLKKGPDSYARLKLGRLEGIWPKHFYVGDANHSKNLLTKLCGLVPSWKMRTHLPRQLFNL